MTPSDANKNPMGELAAEWRERLRRGERPDVDEYVARYPAFADEIRELLPAVVMMEELKPTAGEAEQASLGRRVALKVLPSQALPDAHHQKRFLREARAAARLHHTNIVPVYGVGEHEGTLYYVMQFIQGQGLDAVLEELRKNA